MLNRSNKTSRACVRSHVVRSPGDDGAHTHTRAHDRRSSAVIFDLLITILKRHMLMGRTCAYLKSF